MYPGHGACREGGMAKRLGSPRPIPCVEDQPDAPWEGTYRSLSIPKNFRTLKML